MAENKVSVELTIEQAQALNALSELGKGLDTFSKKATKATSKTSSSFNSFGKTVAAVFTGTVIADFALSAVKSLGQIPGALFDIVEAGAAADAATQKLSVSLALAGASGAESVKAFEDLAEATSVLTGVDDDAIKSAASFALTLGATEEQAKKIIKTAADLSVGLGVDFNTAVQQLSGTLEGSAGKLGKVSFAVRQLDEEALRSGKAIDIIAKKFQGLADVNAGNLTVQFANFTNNVDDLAKAFGQAITASTEFKSLALTLNQGLEQLTAFLKENQQGITNFTTTLVDGFVKDAEATAAFIDAIARFGAAIKNVFELGLGTIVTGLNAVEVGLTKVTNPLREFFGIQPNTDAYDRLSESIKGLEEDSADLQKALGGDALVPGVQAIFDLGNAYEQNAQKIEASGQSVIESEKRLASEAAAARAAENEKKLEEEIAFREQLNAIHNQSVITQQQQELIAQQESLLSLADNNAAVAALEEEKIKLQFDAERRKLELQKDSLQKSRDLQTLDANREKALEEFKTKTALEQQKIRQQNLKDSFNSIATLTSQNNAVLFNIGKAAALATATIDGIAAVQKALASAPPPFNFVLAGLVGTVQALNLSKIASQQPPAFENGGIVGGNSFSGDNVTAQVNSGEMILNRQQQARLFAQANGSPGGGDSVISAINALGDRIAAMQLSLNVNGREIARVVRDEREAGFAV